ncbi:MAG: hypothetical protein ABL931_20215, partial [Usitatibacteraceae bacterium]
VREGLLAGSGNGNVSDFSRILVPFQVKSCCATGTYESVAVFSMHGLQPVDLRDVFSVGGVYQRKKYGDIYPNSPIETDDWQGHMVKHHENHLEWIRAMMPHGPAMLGQPLGRPRPIRSSCTPVKVVASRVRSAA